MDVCFEFFKGDCTVIIRVHFLEKEFERRVFRGTLSNPAWEVQ